MLHQFTPNLVLDSKQIRIREKIGIPKHTKFHHAVPADLYLEYGSLGSDRILSGQLYPVREERGRGGVEDKARERPRNNRER